MTNVTQEMANSRRIKREDYVSCSVAFIDCKKPGSTLKENYSIIGPGVTSSDDQVINLPEPHGFNIGAAAMPNGVTNNLHIHFTAEVFIVHKGEWTFRWGANGENEYVGKEGDVVSVPTWVFRGFTNTGADDGWLFTALGEDNTGGVIFHPDIITEAADYGLYISSDNALIDTSKGDPVPDPSECIQPMPMEEVNALREVLPEEMRKRVVTRDDRDYREAFIDASIPGCGAQIAPVIGFGLTQHRDHMPAIVNPHGYSMEWLRLEAGQRVSQFKLDDKMVIINRSGQLRITFNDAADVSVDLNPMDTYSIPAGAVRSIEACGDETIEALIVVSGNHRKKPEFFTDVISQARNNGYALDASGYVAKDSLIPTYGRGE